MRNKERRIDHTDNTESRSSDTRITKSQSQKYRKRKNNNNKNKNMNTIRIR